MKPAIFHPHLDRKENLTYNEAIKFRLKYNLEVCKIDLEVHSKSFLCPKLKKISKKERRKYMKEVFRCQSIRLIYLE